MVSFNKGFGDLHNYIMKAHPPLFPKDIIDRHKNYKGFSGGDALKMAFDTYGNPEAIVLFVGLKYERSLGDRFRVMMELLEQHGILAIETDLRGAYKNSVFE